MIFQCKSIEPVGITQNQLSPVGMQERSLPMYTKNIPFVYKTISKDSILHILPSIVNYS